MTRRLTSAIGDVLAVVIGARLAVWLLEPIFAPVVTVLVAVLVVLLLLLWSQLGQR